MVTTREAVELVETGARSTRARVGKVPPGVSAATAQMRAFLASSLQAASSQPFWLSAPSSQTSELGVLWLRMQ